MIILSGKKGKLRLKKRNKAQSMTFESVDHKLFSGAGDGYGISSRYCCIDQILELFDVTQITFNSLYVISFKQ